MVTTSQRAGFLPDWPASGLLPRRAIALAGCAALTCLAGCAPPVDCALEPDRCLPPAYRVPDRVSTPIAGPATRAGRPAQGGEAALAPSEMAPKLAAAGVMKGNPNNLLAPSDTMAARTRKGAAGLELPRPTELGGQAGADERLVLIRRVIAAAIPALKAHDFDQFKPWVTKRYAGQFEEIRTKYLERFWRHADKVVAALGSASPNLSLEPAPDGRVLLGVKTAEGTEFKPLMMFEDGSWKIDRL